MGVWPDGYYITFNMFSGTTFLGARACAFDRSKMLTGASATQICFQQADSVAGLLPSDLDGSTPPPSGAPNFLLSYGTRRLNLFKFHVDFATPSNSTFTGPTRISVAAFSPACGGGVCIPQQGTSVQLDSLSGNLMHRLAYRNFGDHEALVANHSVVAGTSVGVRWYEIRDPSGTPALYQQGTFAPDSSYRWMGSIGMDHVGTIAMGYSVSSSSMHPSIAFTGRVPTDPLNNLRAESTIQTGGGSQTGGLDRWGDYSSIAIDPVDDCTFWYTNQYLQSDGSFNWSTRIASFKFDGCIADFSISSSQPSQTVLPGAGATYSLTVTPSGGFGNSVSLSVDGLPAGATASFNPSSVTGSGNSTLSVTTSPTTPAGVDLLTITGTSGGLSHTAQVTLVVAAKATMTSPAPGSTLAGASTTLTWTAGTGVTQYSLFFGTTPGRLRLGHHLSLTGTSYTAIVPAIGATLYVRLWSMIGGVWQYIDYTYTEANLSGNHGHPGAGKHLRGCLDHVHLDRRNRCYPILAVLRNHAGRLATWASRISAGTSYTAVLAGHRHCPVRAALVHDWWGVAVCRLHLHGSELPHDHPGAGDHVTGRLGHVHLDPSSRRYPIRRYSSEARREASTWATTYLAGTSYTATVPVRALPCTCGSGTGSVGCGNMSITLTRKLTFQHDHPGAGKHVTGQLGHVHLDPRSWSLPSTSLCFGSTPGGFDLGPHILLVLPIRLPCRSRARPCTCGSGR